MFTLCEHTKPTHVAIMLSLIRRFAYTSCTHAYNYMFPLQSFQFSLKIDQLMLTSTDMKQFDITRSYTFNTNHLTNVVCDLHIWIYCPF